MRNAFVQELVSLARQHPNIALIVGDLGYSVIEPFVDEFPDRFINAGVAEQNMTGLAAGMASEGYHVFTYSIANFPTFRCAEQIRNDVAYHKLPVTIVSVGGGLAYGALGYSHHAVQDYALMRTMPGMLIAAPADPMEVRACMRYFVENPGPSYLRLGKAGEPCIHSNVPDVSPGRWLKIQEGCVEKNRTFLSTGATFNITSLAAKQSDSLHTLPLWGISSKRFQADQVKNYQSVITVEDHLFDCGMGSWMMEALSSYPKLLQRLKIKALSVDVCGIVGQQSILNKVGGLSIESLNS